MAFNNHPVLSLIPARIGSKGIKKKNLRLLKGKPLLTYTLEAASGSSYIDAIYLSSDDAEILKLGSSFGVYNIIRPAEFASDESTANEVVVHFLSMLPQELISQNPYIVYLQPTSPMRTSLHIDKAFEIMKSNSSRLLMSVLKLTKSPYKSFILDEDGLLKPIFSEQMSNANRQILPFTFYPNGAIYIFQVSEFLKRGSFPSDGSLPYVMSERESLDIDSEDDLIRLEQILNES